MAATPLAARYSTLHNMSMAVVSAAMIVIAIVHFMNNPANAPTLSLNDGGTAQYDAAATTALHDPTKLVFDYLVSAADTPVASMSVQPVMSTFAAIRRRRID